ncbi:alpha-amylase family glycosyl hydrolase [Novosphingobium sp. KA1]|uniref:alpha-amylase family glycosyl hydrolase n=1 Tax=Novosphingobium sp. (strain KA1) TaxID=164608 RepID=UPI001A8DDA01|nr:alpha-amylase family glycosyl hydrolase [Novosphingobium sp. KA1]QSR19767.1 alpha-glucosidase [Novosphingobium sp. KA1]
MTLDPTDAASPETVPAATAQETPPRPWWQGAAIYQIYPRSFQDSDGDGVGDLAGITRRLNYVAALGVDAIWISPFFTSPMRDFGYDVADYRGIDPVFGTMADFDALVARAHELGLKVLIDQVYAHTSDQHAWFAESRQNRDNAKADWYVWHDPNEDGTPPNNWQSVFGGPAWTWDARRRQYYMHTFLKEQPQLNMHNLDVQDAIMDVARFWLERGVDGFRLDALNHAMHDPELRDNPPAPEDGRVRSRPFDYQIKKYSQSHPGMVAVVEKLRGVCDEFSAIHTVAEIGGDHPQADRRAYTSGNHRLNSAYGFDFLYAPALTAGIVVDVLDRWELAPGEVGGWPSWAFENHDAPRAVSRWCAPENRTAFARVKMALLTALRGNVIVYQGEELGLVQDEIPYEQLQDPEAIANWPLTLSRDGVRTPIPWEDTAQGAFTTGTPWLPMSAENLSRAVAVQEADPASLLHFTRHLLALRKAIPALRHGSLVDWSADGDLLMFERDAGTARVRCLFNLSASPIDLPEPATGMIVLSVNGADHDHLPAYGAIWLGTN